MNSLTGIALSGLQAASLRLTASGSNIAHLSVRGAAPGSVGPTVYRPLEAPSAALAAGGVAASLSPSSREAILAYDPSAPFANAEGYVGAPNIDLATELVDLLMARISFAANLDVLRAQDEIAKDARGLLT